MDDPRDLDGARADDDGTRRGLLALGALGAAALLVGALVVFVAPGGSGSAPRAQAPAATAAAANADDGLHDASRRDASTLERELTAAGSRLAAADARVAALGEQLQRSERQLTDDGTRLQTAEAALAEERAARLQRDSALERLHALVASAAADREALAAQLRDARVQVREQELLASAYAAQVSAARECVDGYRRALAYAVQLEPFAAGEPLVAAQGSCERALR